VLRRLEREADASDETEPNAACIRAIELIGKHLGMFVERQRVERSGEIGPREVRITLVKPDGTERRLGGVLGLARARNRRSRPGEEGARFVERRAQRRRAVSVADDVEQIAMLARGCIGELPRCARGREADEEGAPAAAVEVACDPIPAPAAPVGQVAAAHLLGACAEGGRDASGGAHDAHLGHLGEPAEPGSRAEMGRMRDLSGRCVGRAPVPSSTGLSPAPGRGAAREAHGAPSGLRGLGIGCKKTRPAREERGAGSGASGPRKPAAGRVVRMARRLPLP